MRATVNDPALGTTEACAGALIMRQASLAGGLGACYAPNGEREGQSPLAEHESTLRRGARGAKPTRIPRAMQASVQLAMKLRHNRGMRQCADHAPSITYKRINKLHM